MDKKAFTQLKANIFSSCSIERVHFEFKDSLVLFPCYLIFIRLVCKRSVNTQIRCCVIAALQKYDRSTFLYIISIF